MDMIQFTYFRIRVKVNSEPSTSSATEKMAEIESHESATSSYENYESGVRSSSSGESVISWSSDDSETRSEDGNYPCQSVS